MFEIPLRVLNRLLGQPLDMSRPFIQLTHPDGSINATPTPVSSGRQATSAPTLSSRSTPPPAPLVLAACSRSTQPALPRSRCKTMGCGICGQRFIRTSNRDVHVQRHFEQAVFRPGVSNNTGAGSQCLLCGFCGLAAGDRLTHLRSHLNDSDIASLALLLRRGTASVSTYA